MLSRFVKALARVAIGFLIFSGVLTGIFSILGYFGQSTWDLDLLSHFRVQYTAWLCLLALLFITYKQRIWSLIFFIFALVNLPEILPYYLQASAHEARNIGSLRLMQVNLWSQHEDYSRILKAIKEAEPDIISFQELTPRSAEVFERELQDYPFRIMKPQDDCFGIGLASRIYLDKTDGFQAIDEARKLVSPPVVTAEFRCLGRKLNIISVHLLPPLSERSVDTNRMLCTYLAEYCRQNRPAILIGDLNYSRHSAQFKKLKAEAGLLDSQDGAGYQPSFPTMLPLLSIPIDHVLFSKDGFTVTKRRTAGYCGSDHFPLIVDIR